MRAHLLGWTLVAALLLEPLLEKVLHLPHSWGIAQLLMPVIFAYTIIGLGLNIITGFTGLLNLGVAGFVAIGAYAYSMATSPIYPFQIGFWPGLGVAILVAAGVGAALSLPTMRLRGDYLAIVTLGFSEIIEDLLKNLAPITKGTTGIDPVPPPSLPGLDFTTAHTLDFYYLYLALAALAALIAYRLRQSRVGRGWVAVREDELAARASGVVAVRAKLSAFCWGSAFAGAGGALLVAQGGTSFDPDYYSFQQSIIVLSAVIVGGMGSIPGVLLGSALMFGLNSVVLVKLPWLMNAKYLLYGLTMILAMRFMPRGLVPVRETGQRPPPPGAVRVGA